MIPKHKVDDIWTSGFCREAVEQARTTDDSLQGSESRVDYMRGHIEDCSDCYHARILKNAEAEVAAAMGPQAVGAFFRGENITVRPGYSKDLVRQALVRIRERGQGTPEFDEWINRVSKRKRYKKRR